MTFERLDTQKPNFMVKLVIRIHGMRTSKLIYPILTEKETSKLFTLVLLWCDQNTDCILGQQYDTSDMADL